MRVVGLVGLLCALILPNAARADWEFTRWGMTPGQVLEASGGRVIVPDIETAKGCSTDTGRCLLLLPQHMVGPFTFEARFLFDARSRLTAVHLTTDASHYHALEKSLSGTFGAAVSKTVNRWLTSTTWRDEKRGNTVTLHSPIIGATVIYAPIAPGF